jgi:uncharacterized DUF497 family protein
MEFEWDLRKAERNLAKHGVSFDEARTVFGDALAATVSDSLHSHSEPRFVTMGRSSQGRVLVVVHTDRADRIRLISARQASSRERKQYES